MGARHPDNKTATTSARQQAGHLRTAGVPATGSTPQALPRGPSLGLTHTHQQGGLEPAQASTPHQSEPWVWLLEPSPCRACSRTFYQQRRAAGGASRAVDARSPGPPTHAPPCCLREPRGKGGDSRAACCRLQQPPAPAPAAGSLAHPGAPAHGLRALGPCPTACTDPALTRGPGGHGTRRPPCHVSVPTKTHANRRTLGSSRGQSTFPPSPGGRSAMHARASGRS